MYRRAPWAIPGLTLTAVLFISAMTFTGCSSKQAEPGGGPDAASASIVTYPPPPDTARIQFLTRFAAAEDIEAGGGGSFLDAIVGSDPRDSENQIIYKPYGVSIARGVIYACDTMIQGVVVMDVAGEEMAVLRPDEGPGVLMKPINCFADRRDGRLYVADVGRAAVLVYDAQLSFAGAIESGDDLTRPVDVQVRGDTIWVADQVGHRIVLYDRQTLKRIGKIPDLGPADEGGIRQPTNIWVTEDEVYVSDFGDFKVKVYTHDGEFVRSVGQYGRGFGMFLRPKGIAVDRDDILYVVDAGFHNVQMFNDQGEVLMFFGGPTDDPGHMYLPAKVTIDYDNIDLFREYVDPRFDVKHLIIVTNQYGTDKINVYARVVEKAAAAEQVTESTGAGD